jgi:DNA-binding NarL/FixJ family response regulator
MYHAMVRQGLRSMLESYPEIEVVGEAVVLSIPTL